MVCAREGRKDAGRAPRDESASAEDAPKSACAPQPANHIMLACARLIMLAWAGFGRDFGE
jgi:hypothetical protein